MKRTFPTLCRCQKIMDCNMNDCSFRQESKIHLPASKICRTKKNVENFFNARMRARECFQQSLHAFDCGRIKFHRTRSSTLGQILSHLRGMPSTPISASFQLARLCALSQVLSCWRLPADVPIPSEIEQWRTRHFENLKRTLATAQSINMF